jgi:hypothetical protein
MSNFELPSQYQHAKVQESASADGYSIPQHSQFVLEVLHVTTTFRVVLCWHNETNMVTNRIYDTQCSV